METKEAPNPAPKEDLTKLKIPELKERLKAANLPVSGRKADLIERLQNMAGDHMLTENHGKADNKSDDGKLEEFTVAELKDRLRAANLPVSGRKAELIERLRHSY